MRERRNGYFDATVRLGAKLSIKLQAFLARRGLESPKNSKLSKALATLPTASPNFPALSLNTSMRYWIYCSGHCDRTPSSLDVWDLDSLDSFLEHERLSGVRSEVFSKLIRCNCKRLASSSKEGDGEGRTGRERVFGRGRGEYYL